MPYACKAFIRKGLGPKCAIFTHAQHTRKKRVSQVKHTSRSKATPSQKIRSILREIVEALTNTGGREITRQQFILRFYGRQDVSTSDLDKAINILLNHRIIETGYFLTDDYEVRYENYEAKIDLR